MSNIDIKIDDSICTIRLNRADKKNAITSEMYALMANALEAAADNPNVKVIVLLGSEGHFTAGNDLGDFLSNPSLEPGSPVHRFLTALVNCSLPLIAAVSGYAVGIGSTLLLHCERVFVDETAKLSFPFINLGLVPEAGSTLLLPRLVGYSCASDLLLTGRVVSAQEALDVKLVNEMVPDVDAAALAYAGILSQKSRAMLIEIKSLLRRSEENLSARMDVELISFVRCLNSAAAKEAMAAFLEKRRPDFSKL